jgi:hypothetical protein
MDVVVTFDLGRSDVGVGILDGFCDASAPLVFLLLLDDLDESAPPTPPPTAAATTIRATSSAIQNVLLRKPAYCLYYVGLLCRDCGCILRCL